MATKRSNRGKTRDGSGGPRDLGLQTGEEIAFVATFPHSDGAIKRHGAGGFRLVFDVSEDDFAPIVRMMALIGTQFECRVRPRLGAVAHETVEPGPE